MERLAYLVALEIVLLLVVYRLMFRLLLRDYPISRTTISTREIRLKQARTMSAARLIFLVIAGVLMTAASGFSFWLSLRSPDWHTAISGFGVLFFGASLIVIIRMIFMRNSSVPTP